MYNQDPNGYNQIPNQVPNQVPNQNVAPVQPQPVQYTQVNPNFVNEPKKSKIPKSAIRNTIILIAVIIVVGAFLDNYIEKSTVTLECTYHEEYLGITVDVVDSYTFRNDSVKTGSTNSKYDFSNAKGDYSSQYSLIKTQVKTLKDNYDDNNWSTDVSYKDDEIILNAEVKKIDTSKSKYVTLNEYKDYYESQDYECKTIE